MISLETKYNRIDAALSKHMIGDRLKEYICDHMFEDAELEVMSDREFNKLLIEIEDMANALMEGCYE